MQSIIDLLHRAEQASKAIFAGASLPSGATGITLRQFSVLEAVGKCPGTSQTDLVLATRIDRSTLADLVRRLAEKGLIQRVRLEYAGGDARMYSVSLTKKGESMVEALKPVNDAVNSRLLNVLGDGERAAFIASLAKLADAPLSAYIG